MGSIAGLEGDIPPRRGLALPELLPRLAYEPRAEPEVMNGGIGRSRTSPILLSPPPTVAVTAVLVAWFEELLLLLVVLAIAEDREVSASFLRSRSCTMGVVERAWESWEEEDDRLQWAVEEGNYGREKSTEEKKRQGVKKGGDEGGFRISKYGSGPPSEKRQKRKVSSGGRGEEKERLTTVSEHGPSAKRV